MRRIYRRLWRRWPLVAKLTLAMTCLIVVIVASVTTMFIRREQQNSKVELEEQAKLLLATLAAASADPLYTLDADQLSDTVEALGLQALDADQQILASGRIYDPNGRIIADAYDPMLAFSRDIDPLGQQLINSDAIVFNWADDQLVAGRAINVGSQRFGAVSIGLSTAPLQAKIAEVRNQGIVIAVITALIGAGLAVILSRSITGPLSDLVTATERIAQGDLNQQISVGSGDELAILGYAMERMRAELLELYEGLEQEVATRTQELRESEERFRQVASSISDHVYMSEIRSDGQYVNHYIAPNAEELTGYPYEKFAADWSFWPTQVIHPDDRAEAAAQAKRFAQGQSSEMEYRMVRADGRIIWVRDSAQVKVDPDSQSIFVFGVVSDITDRKRAEETLERQRAFLQQVIDINPHFIFAKDRDMRFTLVNEAFAKAYGATVEALIGKTDADMNPIQEMVEQYNQDDLTVIETGEDLVLSEVQVINIKGQRRWRHVIKRPILDDEGRPHQVLGVVTDISDRKMAEEDLAEARDQALAASRLKSELLARVSHELRTPLGAITGFAEMLHLGLYGALSDKQTEITERIMKSTDALTDLVSELLDQARLDAGSLELAEETFSPTSLIDRMLVTADVLANQKGLRLSTEVAYDLPPTLMGDPDRLLQILVNLTGNAIKFTEDGAVHVRLYRPDHDHWAMEVTDTGPGIDAETQAFIFEAFRQADGTLTRKYGGSGLGLSIVKQLTSLMSGEVMVDSQVGQGSTFTVLLPLERMPEHAI